MTIRLVCPGCRKQLAVPDATAGQMGQCPVCKTLFNVPAAIQPKPLHASAPLPPQRRTAVARPIPQPVLGEDAPTTGLTVLQKLAFAAVAAGVLAAAGFFVHRSMNANGPAPDDGRAVMVDASDKAPPRPRPEPWKPATATAVPAIPEPARPNDEGPRPPVDSPEEDTGPKPPPQQPGPPRTEPATLDPPKPTLAQRPPPPAVPQKPEPVAAAPPVRDVDEPPKTRPGPKPVTDPPAQPAPEATSPPKPARVRLAEYAERFKTIDAHALQAPAEAEQSIAALAAYLVKPARDDVEKVRAIYRWTTDRVAYDAPAFLAGRLPADCSAATVFKTRLTVCEGYANLVAALCKQAGVVAGKVRGHCKGYGYQSGQKTAHSHAWNAIRCGDGWALLDATWGSGAIDASKNFAKRFEPYFFLPLPEQLVFSHFPTEPAWQLLTPAVTPEDYARWPRVEAMLFKLGANAKQVRDQLDDRAFRGFVKTFSGWDGIKILNASIAGHLSAGQVYEFEIEAPTAVSMAANSNGKMHAFTKRGNVFSAKIIPPLGGLKIMAQLPGKGKAYWSLLEYTVEPASAAAP